MDQYGTHSFSAPEPIVRQICDACGTGSVLDVGSGMGLLVETLLAAGVDARGLDVAYRVVKECNDRLPGRFQQASVLALPFRDDSFDTVWSSDCLEHIAPEDIPLALREMARVTRKNLFLRIATTVDRDQPWQPTIQKRDWWEQQLFAAGFRKHPNSFRVNSYEGLEHDARQITILMEKIPPAALLRYPNPPARSGNDAALVDMLRTTGRDSDAHLACYHLAGQYVRPGDTVLEIGSGSAAGLHVLRNNCPARRFIAVERSAEAVEYGRANFGEGRPNIEFHAGEPRAALAAWPDHSINVVIVFDLLERDADPPALLREIKRLLIPGGRVILSVARAPVMAAEAERALAFDQLRDLVGVCFLLENLYQQHVDPAPASSADPTSAGRWLRQVSWSSNPTSTGQWWIATAISDPVVGAAVPYTETVFSNVASAQHVSTQYARWYRNPWIVHSIVHVGYRVRSTSLLSELAERLLAGSPPDSADHGAALCILAYRLAGERAFPAQAIASLLDKISPFLALSSENPHVYRWQISLTFVAGQLEVKRGFIARARGWFEKCSGMDPFRFSVHLATKTAEAFFWSGWLALNQGDVLEAQRSWKAGVEFGNRLLGRPIDDVLINAEDPNIFDHGDGMREFVHATESITRCANGIHLLQRSQEGRAVNWSGVYKTFRGKSEEVSQDLLDTQAQSAVITAQLVATRAELVSRTTEVDAARADLIARTAEVDIARAELDVALRHLTGRTDELDAARKELIDRTGELEAARGELISRTEEVDAARKDLISRTGELDAVRQELVSRTLELDAEREKALSLSRSRWRWFARRNG